MAADPDNVPTLLLTGVVASGKTAVAVELGHRLGQARLPTVIIDLDWLGWAHLGVTRPSADDLIIDNLGAIWPNFRRAGMRYAVMARAGWSPQLTDRLSTAAPGADLTVVELTASMQTIEQRLVRRDKGVEVSENLREAASLLRLGPAHAAFTIDTSSQTVAQVADSILSRLGWT